MARLIDADDVLQRFIQESEYSGVNVVHINTIKRILQDIDTAYNVDKVVEELEEETEVFTLSETMHIKYAIPKYKAIDIVRKGGVNDD